MVLSWNIEEFEIAMILAKKYADMEIAIIEEDSEGYEKRLEIWREMRVHFFLKLLQEYSIISRGSLRNHELKASGV